MRKKIQIKINYKICFFVLTKVKKISIFHICMADSLTVYSPAKINLGLKVFPKRSDGFHSISSIFTTVDLCDELEVSLVKEKNVCNVKCKGMELPPDNTFTAAYKAFCVLTGIQDGVSVNVTKHIPSGGGLGGGSSNASSFIQSIDSLFNTHLKASQLHELAGKVGSDVFFFTSALWHRMQKGYPSSRFAALVEGRGEIINPICARDDFAVVLVFPGVSVSTKAAYALVDEAFENGTLSDEIDDVSLEHMYKSGVADWKFKNSFTIPVISRYPEIAHALNDIREAGADFADMTGSGSTVFGIFAERKDALKASERLLDKWKTVLA
ncbi:4-(cytidine 5'-diphospho)-2-C-methyl-D-erythritol kinase [Treponema rectale]|uniref:4-diphosphocytidyl-2-C-methyl-D-erythritol kinase n=2 Tax=Treponema rectale TaxID=744512 RepID=A0A7M1XQD1_9SPIR|nr:4-(cytidine 5'-diphospho)-2-C-methyl-D-erythritol kinase [Treponema sp.]QOS40382.1 4-(cytidine 5'-diphospho)-2-C-methyl-D-erythritol kinase [Treponema rectale]